METSKIAKIVVVEDEPLLLETIMKRFNSKDILSVGFPSAEEAVNYLNSLKKVEELPKVIWLDYYLGNMTGIEFVESIKKKPLLANIPILVISNGADNEVIKKLLKLGVKKYLLKANYRLDDLIGLAQEFL